MESRRKKKYYFIYIGTSDSPVCESIYIVLHIISNKINKNIPLVCINYLFNKKIFLTKNFLFHDKTAYFKLILLIV